MRWLRFAPLFATLAFATACAPTEGTLREPDAGGGAEVGLDTSFLEVEPLPDVGVVDGDATLVDTSVPIDGDATLVDTFVPPVDTGPAGDGAPSCGDAADAGTLAPVVEKKGVADKVLLKGMVVTPDTAFAGEVLVEGTNITCVAASCSASPGAATASVVQTNGIIFPGLIDSHNHILFDIFDETDWSPAKVYDHHDQWPTEKTYGAVIDAKQYLNGEGASTWDFGCEMLKYGELKAMIAGTTAVLGAANPINRLCYGSLARTIDQTGNELGSDKMQVATLFPKTADADGVCANIASGKTDAYVIHIGEGKPGNAYALKEFTSLESVTTTKGCLLAPQTMIVHGTALGAPEFTIMGSKGMSLTWSPQSNVFLYGGNTDLTQTTNIPVAMEKGVNVALSPDWSMGGSQNLLDELRFAQKVNTTVWASKLTSKQLVQMVTSNPAKALHLDALIGSIAVGKRADLMVIGGNTAMPYDALIAARPSDVRMVMVNGVTLYGDLPLESIAPASPGCEHLDICCASKFVCVARDAGATATNKFKQTYKEIVDALSKALSDYDASIAASDAATKVKVHPLTPLVRCK